MKTTIVRIAACVAALALTACGRESGKDAEPQPDASSAAQPGAESTEPSVVAAPKIVDGYQVVRVIVRNTGYEPDKIHLQAGMPAKLVFVQRADTQCASQIQIPSLGVPVTDLPQNKETVVEFSPKEAGMFTFMCGMDMMRGTILVTS